MFACFEELLLLAGSGNNCLVTPLSYIIIITDKILFSVRSGKTVLRNTALSIPARLQQTNVVEFELSCYEKCVRFRSSPGRTEKQTKNKQTNNKQNMRPVLHFVCKASCLPSCWPSSTDSCMMYQLLFSFPCEILQNLR